jgi:hypothetical protein
MRLALSIGAGLMAAFALAATFVYVAWRTDRASRRSTHLILGSPPLPTRPAREDCFGLREYVPSALLPNRPMVPAQAPCSA